MNEDKSIKQAYKFISGYTDMIINNLTINCPYWRNKIRKGKISHYGFQGGKGPYNEIKMKLRELVAKELKTPGFINKDKIVKLARRERIGIDCSGFAYRLLDYLAQNNYRNSKLKTLDNLFKGGIRKTNVKRMTDRKYARLIKNVEDVRLGDLIRMRGGNHLAVILERKGSVIIYVHSASITTIGGVHLGKIYIINPSDNIWSQDWEEKTKDNIKINEKYFQPGSGDGIYRLKIFNH